MSCSLRIVRAILRRGGQALVDSKDGSGYTPLMTASEYGRQEIVDFLIRCQAHKLEGNRVSIHTQIEQQLGQIEQVLRTVYQSGLVARSVGA